jgi:hypothetical protein
MKLLFQETTIPVPDVIACGMANETPSGLGPFILMTFAQGELLPDVLKAKSEDHEDGEVLDQAIEDAKLEHVYRQMSNIMLKFSKLTFDSTGSITSNEDGTWTAKERPLTLNMKESVRCGNLSPDEFLSKTYSTVKEFFEELSNEHLQRSRIQCNIVNSSDDCKKSYNTRHLFQQISCSSSLLQNHGPFTLFCDDFGPGNVLVDSSLNITAVLDLEFSYAAPFQFTYSPPCGYY